MNQEERDGLKILHSAEVRRLRLISQIKNEEKKFSEGKKELNAPLKVMEVALHKIEESLRSLAIEKERECGILKSKKERLSKTPNKLKGALSRDVFQTQKLIDKIDEDIKKLVAQHAAEKKNFESERGKVAEHDELIDIQAKEVREEIASIKERLSGAEQEIESIKGSLPDNVAKEFYKVFDRNPMDTIVPVSEDRKCSACFLSVNPQHFIKLHEKGVFIRCAGCGRLLE